MSPPLRRRSFLALLGTTTIAGCHSMGSSERCPFAFDRPVAGWPLPYRDPGNTGVAPGAAAPALADASEAWTATWRRHLRPTVVADGTVFVPGRRIDTDAPQGEEPPPTLFAVEGDTGDQRWRRDIVYEPEPGQATLERPIAAGHGHVYAIQRTLDDAIPNRLLALDAATGDRVWRHEGVRSAGLHLGAGVVLARADRAIRALDPRNGSPCRTLRVQGVVDRQLTPRTLAVRSAVGGTRLFVASVRPPDDRDQRWRYWLAGIDLESGVVEWTSDRLASEEYVPNVVMADAQRVYLPSGNRLHAFAHDGQPRWSQPIVPDVEPGDRPPLVSGLATTGSRLVVHVTAGADAGGLYGLDAARGAVSWHRTGFLGTPVIAGERLYTWRNEAVGDGDDDYVSVLHELAVSTGATRATNRVDGTLTGPPRVAGGRLFAMTADHGEDPNRGRPTYRVHALA